VSACVDRPWVRAAVVALACAAAFGDVRTKSHYADEAIGGALAGWTLAAASLAVAARVYTPFHWRLR
jgi:hypothetical protein